MCDEKFKNINFVVYLLDQDLKKSSLFDGCISIFEGDDNSLDKVTFIFENFLNQTFGEAKC